MQSSILIRHLLSQSFANATCLAAARSRSGSYSPPDYKGAPSRRFATFLEKASHAKNFYQKSKCCCLPIPRGNQFSKIFSESSIRGHLERSPAEISLRDFACAKFRLRAAHYAQNDSGRAKSKRKAQTAKPFGSRGGKSEKLVCV